MTDLLCINGSIRDGDSRSRLLADHLIEAFRSTDRLGLLAARDVGIDPPAAPTEAFVVANHTDPSSRTEADRAVLAESDALIEEFLAAQLIVVATPMYNFSAGPGLKAWVDNLIRKDRTFRATPSGIERLAEGKRMVVISTRGLAYGPGSPFAECDHLTGWIRDIFGLIGVDDIDFVTADNLDFATPADADASIAAAKASIDQLVASW